MQEGGGGARPQVAQTGGVGGGLARIASPSNQSQRQLAEEETEEPIDCDQVQLTLQTPDQANPDMNAILDHDSQLSRQIYDLSASQSQQVKAIRSLNIDNSDASAVRQQNAIEPAPNDRGLAQRSPLSPSVQSERKVNIHSQIDGSMSGFRDSENKLNMPSQSQKLTSPQDTKMNKSNSKFADVNPNQATSNPHAPLLGQAEPVIVARENQPVLDSHHLSSAGKMIFSTQEQHHLTSIASFGQIQHQRIKSLHSSKQPEASRDNVNQEESSQHDQMQSSDQQQLTGRGLLNSGKRGDNTAKLQSYPETKDGQSSHNAQLNQVVSHQQQFNQSQQLSEHNQSRGTDGTHAGGTFSKLGSVPISSRVAIKMAGNVARTKNQKSFGQSTDRSNLTSLSSQHIKEIQQSMNQLGVKRNSRVNSQIFNEQAIAAIQAANVIFKQQNAAAADNMAAVNATDETSPSNKHMVLRGAGPESPKKLKLTLKGDKYIQKFQKPRDEKSGEHHQLIQASGRQMNENSVDGSQQIEVKKRLSQISQGKVIPDDTSATPKSPVSSNMNDVSELSAKKSSLAFEGQQPPIFNQQIIQKLSTGNAMQSKRGADGSGKSSSFAPIISKEQIKFYKNATTNRDNERSCGSSAIDQSKQNIYMAPSETSASARLLNSSAKNLHLHQQNTASRNETAQAQSLNQSGFNIPPHEASPHPLNCSQDQPSCSSRRHYQGGMCAASIPVKSSNQKQEQTQSQQIQHQIQSINLNKITVNRKGVQKNMSSTAANVEAASGHGATGNTNTQIIIGQSLLTKRSHQANQLGNNFTLRSQSSQNSGGFAAMNAGNATHGTTGILGGTICASQNSYRADPGSSSLHKSKHKMSPDVKGIATIISEHQQDPYAYYILNQNKMKQNVNVGGLQGNNNGGSGQGSGLAQPNFQINVKSSSQTQADQQMKKLGTQLIGSVDGSSLHNQTNQGQFEEGSNSNFEMGVKSCRPNLYNNKHRLIISQRGGATPYQLALIAANNQQNGGNLPGGPEALTFVGQNQQVTGSNAMPLCGQGIPQIESGSRDISNTNLNSQSTGPRRHENNTRQQSLEKHILLLQEMQASGRTSGVSGTQQFINFGGRPAMGGGVPSSGSHQQKSFDLHDSNKKNYGAKYHNKHVMSPGGGTVFVQHQDQHLQRRLDDRQILSGAIDGRNRGGFHNLINNYQENYYQNQSLTSNNERVNAKISGKGFVKFSGSGSHGSNFNSSVSTFPAAPIQKLSDVKNPQKLLTFRFVNRKVTKISEIQLFKNLRELDLTGNMLQEVKELNSLNFLKNLNLSYNKIQQLWMLPKRIEILNLAHNQIKSMPEDVSKNLRNVTTIDVSSNKLESLENFRYMHRIKRLVAKNNFIRQIAPIKSIENIYELDLEGNAVDSHIDFLEFIKGKNDLIVINLHLNPIMVEVDSIEKINEELIAKAPDKITRKTKEEIEELKELMAMGNNNVFQNLSDLPASTHSINNKSQSNSVDGQGPANVTSGTHNKRTSGGGLHSTPGNDNIENSNRKGIHAADDDTNRLYNKLHLIKELADCLSYFKNGVLYRNKRVFNKIRQIQQQQQYTKRSISNYSNSSHSAAAINQSMHYQQNQNQNPGAMSCGGNQNASGSGRKPAGRSMKPMREGGQHLERDGSSQGKQNASTSNKLSPNNGVTKPGMSSGENNNIPRPQATNPMTGKPYGQKNNLSNSIGYSPIVSKKSHRYEDIENLYDYIVEQEELKRLKQQKIFAKRRKQKKKQLMSQIGPSGVNNSELIDAGRSQSQQNNDRSQQYPQQFQEESSDDNNSSDDFSDDDIDDEDDYFDDLENSRDMNFLEQQKQYIIMSQAHEDPERIAMLKAGRLPSAEAEDMSRYLNMVNAFNKNGEPVGVMDESSCLIAQNSSRILNNSYHMQNYQYQQHLHDDDAVSQTITSDLDADLHSYPYKKVELNLELEALYDPNHEQNYQQNGSQIDDNDYLNGSTAGFGKKLREINREINQEQLESLADGQSHHHLHHHLHPSAQLNSKGVLIVKDSHRADSSHLTSIQSSHPIGPKIHSQSAQKARLANLNVPSTTKQTKQKLNLNLSKITIDQENLKSSPQKQRKIKSDVPILQDNTQKVMMIGQAPGVAAVKGKDELAVGRPAGARIIKDSHLTQSDLKLKQQLAMYEGEEQESPGAGKISQANGLDVNQPREGIQSELKIDQRMMEELTINRKKQIKTVQNSNESSQESDSPVGSVDHLGLNIGKGLLKGTNSKNEIGICTITNSNSDKHMTGNQQQLNQSFSLKNIAGDASQQHEVESLMMQIIERGPQAVHNEFSAKNENYAAAYNVLQVAGQSIPFQSLRNCEGLAGMSNINSQKYNSIMQASLSQNIDAPDFLKKPSTANLLTKVNHSEQQSHALLDDSMAQSGLSFTQNSKKNMHPHFKLDLSKCIDYNDDYIEGTSGQSSEQKLGANFLDDIKQPSLHKDADSNAKKNNSDLVNINENNLDNIETVKIEISKQNYKNKHSSGNAKVSHSANIKSLRDKIKISSSRRSVSKQDKDQLAKDDGHAGPSTDYRVEIAKAVESKPSQQQAAKVSNQKSPMIVKKFNLSKDYQQQRDGKATAAQQRSQNTNSGENAAAISAQNRRGSDVASYDQLSDANIALASQEIPRPNMTERDPTPALKTQQLHENKDGSNIPNLNALKPPLEENSNKVKTERHTKTPGQNNKLKGLIQLSHHKNKKGEILLQIPQSKIQRYNLDNGTKLKLPGSEIAQNGTPKMGGSAMINQCNECAQYQGLVLRLKEDHHQELEKAREVAQTYRQQLLDIKDYLCINGELQDLFELDHAKSAGNRQIRVNQFSSIVQQFFQKFSQELTLLEKDNARLQQNVQILSQIASGDLSLDQKHELEEIQKLQARSDIVHQKTRQSIKIPNMDQMESRTHQPLTNANVSLNSNFTGIRIQPAPKTITSRQEHKRKSLERQVMGPVTMDRSDSKTRANDQMAHRNHGLGNSQQSPQNRHGMPGNVALTKSYQNAQERHQHSLSKENPSSEGQRVPRKQNSMNNNNHMNISYTHGQPAHPPDVDQMNFELSDNHRVQLQELEEGDCIAQYVVAQLQNRNSDALDIKTVFTNRNTLEPTQCTNQLAQELLQCNSNLISIDIFDRAGHAQSQNASQLQTQTQVAAIGQPQQKLIQLTSKGDREYEQNTFSQSSNQHLTKLYTNRQGKDHHHSLNQQSSLVNSAHPKHLRQRGTNSGITGRHGGTVEDCRSAQPPILSQQTSLQTSSVQLNDKKIIIQKQNMLSQNLSVNTNIDVMASSSFNVPHQNNTVNVSMIVGGGAGSQGGVIGGTSKPSSGSHHGGAANTKMKSQRACHVKLLQQQVNNYTGGNIINELNNLQLIQQQLMRNKSNTSRGTKGSAQYREQLLNLNQTSQSSINPQNYLTSKRKSPKLAQKLKGQKQLQNIIGDEQKMQQFAVMQGLQQMYQLQHQSQGNGVQNIMTPHPQLQPYAADSNMYHLDVSTTTAKQQHMAMINAPNIGMTILDNRNPTSVATDAALGTNANNQLSGPGQKQKKTSSVNSRTAKENWKSLQQSAQQVQSMDFSGKTGKKVNKIADNQKSLERIVAYQSSGTQYKTSRLPLSNQKMVDGNENMTNASGTGTEGYHRNEVFLSQPQQSKKSQSQYQAKRDSTINSGSVGLSNKAPHSGTGNSKNRVNLSSMGPAGKQNQDPKSLIIIPNLNQRQRNGDQGSNMNDRQSNDDQKSLIGSEDNDSGQELEFDLQQNFVHGGTQDRRQRAAAMDTSLASGVNAPIPDDTTFGYNGSCEVKLLGQNLEHIQPSYYTQRKLLNPKPTTQAPIPGSSTVNASSSQSKNVLLSLQNQKQQSFQQQHQYSLQKSTNQQYQINVMKQKNKFLESRSKSIQRHQDGRQIVTSCGYSQLLDHLPVGAAPMQGPPAGCAPGANPSSTIATAGNQSRQKLSNKCSNIQVGQGENTGAKEPAPKYQGQQQPRQNESNVQMNNYNNNKNIRGQSINLLIGGTANSTDVPPAAAQGIQLLSKQYQQSASSGQGGASKGAQQQQLQQQPMSLQLQDSVESTSNKKSLATPNDIVIYSANSGKRPQSVVEVGGRRFQKGGVIGHGQAPNHKGSAWPQLMSKGGFTNTHGGAGGSLVGSKKERKGRGKSSDQKNNKTVYLKNSKQLQAKNSLNTTDINHIQFFDMNKKIEQNIQKIQQIQNAKQMQIQRSKEMASNRDSDINLRQHMHVLL